jgi:hypothetical protein
VKLNTSALPEVKDTPAFFPKIQLAASP